MLSSLSAQETLQLCEGVSDWYSMVIDPERYARAYCVVEAISDSEVATFDNGMVDVDVAACQAASSACLAAGNGVLSIDCAQDQAERLMDFATCHATVASYETCVVAAVEHSPSGIDAYTCEDAERLLQESLEASLARQPGDPPPLARIPGCAPYVTQCPETQP